MYGGLRRLFHCGERFACRTAALALNRWEGTAKIGLPDKKFARSTCTDPPGRSFGWFDMLKDFSFFLKGSLAVFGISIID